MKRRNLLAAAAGCVALTTGCIPNPVLDFPSLGFPHARDAAGPGVLYVDNRAHPFNVPAGDIVAPWNWMAGHVFLVPMGRGDPAGANAHIRFEVMSPICAYGNCDDRRAAWVDPDRNADGTFNGCTIYYDPLVPSKPAAWKPLLSHELGHCLGFMTGPYVDATHPDYQGVMSYWWFNTQSGWWGAADREMVSEAGY